MRRGTFSSQHIIDAFIIPWGIIPKGITIDIFFREWIIKRTNR